MLSVDFARCLLCVTSVGPARGFPCPICAREATLRWPNGSSLRAKSPHPAFDVHDGPALRIGRSRAHIGVRPPICTLGCVICRLRYNRQIKSSFFINSDCEMIAQEAGRFAIGTRFKISPLGAVRCPDLADRTGTVVEFSPRTSGVTVLFDGAARPTVLHCDYITPLSE